MQYLACSRNIVDSAVEEDTYMYRLANQESRDVNQIIEGTGRYGRRQDLLVGAIFAGKVCPITVYVVQQRNLLR